MSLARYLFVYPPIRMHLVQFEFRVFNIFLLEMHYQIGDESRVTSK